MLSNNVIYIGLCMGVCMFVCMSVCNMYKVDWREPACKLLRVYVHIIALYEEV